MELAPVPIRPSLMGRLWLVVAIAVLAPLVLLVVLPTVLGLERYVVTSDALGDTVPRGSLTFAERVPGSDLRAGDVITFRPPSAPSSAPLVTRRVVAASDSGIRTAADSTGTDPWVLPTDVDRSRVIWHIPYVGYPFSGGVQPTIWVMLASVPMLAVLLAVVADLDRARQRRRAVRRQEHLHVTDV
jgi:signal peptidase I